MFIRVPSLIRHTTRVVLKYCIVYEEQVSSALLFLYLVLLKEVPTCVALILLLGTSAQQLDASFSTNATLEIFEVDFRDPALDMKQKGTLSASNRY